MSLPLFSTKLIPLRLVVATVVFWFAQLGCAKKEIPREKAPNSCKGELWQSKLARLAQTALCRRDNPPPDHPLIARMITSIVGRDHL